jgi:integrase
LRPDAPGGETLPQGFILVESGTGGADDIHRAAEESIAYAFGWRTQSEVMTLQRRQVDLDAGTLRLDPGTTKNDDRRLVYMPPDLKRLVAAQVGRVRALERKLGRVIPFLFPRLRGRRAGERRRGDRVQKCGRTRTAPP